jgi:hypothetical protein
MKIENTSFGKMMSKETFVKKLCYSCYDAINPDHKRRFTSAFSAEKVFSAAHEKYKNLSDDEVHCKIELFLKSGNTFDQKFSFRRMRY